MKDIVLVSLQKMKTQNVLVKFLEKKKDVLETLEKTEDEYLKLYNEYETLKSLIEGFIWIVVGIVIAFFVIFLIS